MGPERRVFVGGTVVAHGQLTPDDGTAQGDDGSVTGSAVVPGPGDSERRGGDPDSGGPALASTSRVCSSWPPTPSCCAEKQLSTHLNTHVYQVSN